MAANQTDALQRVGENLYVNDHGTYFAWFSVAGKQIKRSLKTTDKTLARRRLSELREKGSRLHGGEKKNIHFDELVKMWLESIRNEVKESTYVRRIVCLNQLTPFFKGASVRSIGIQQIEKWKIARSGEIAPRTFNKELETLNHVLRYARDVKGLLLENPAEKIRNRKADVSVVQIPDKDQFCALVAEIRKEPQAVRSGAADFVELLGYSGLRLGEAIAVQWCDVNFDLGTLLVTGGEEGTKITRHVHCRFSHRCGDCWSGYSTNGKTRSITMGGFSDFSISGRRLCRRANVPGYRTSAIMQCVISSARMPSRPDAISK